MTLRASACVLTLAVIFASGCSGVPLTKPIFEKECERVETAWDAEVERVVVIEHGCKSIEPEKEMQGWVLLFQVIRLAIAIAAIAL